MLHVFIAWINIFQIKQSIGKKFLRKNIFRHTNNINWYDGIVVSNLNAYEFFNANQLIEKIVQWSSQCNLCLKKHDIKGTFRERCSCIEMTSRTSSDSPRAQFSQRTANKTHQWRHIYLTRSFLNNEIVSFYSVYRLELSQVTLERVFLSSVIWD